VEARTRFHRFFIVEGTLLFLGRTKGCRKLVVVNSGGYSCLGREAMEVQISGVSQSQREQFLDQAKELLDTTRGALRLSEVSDKKTKQKVLYLRERTWGEFFLEKLILTPQEMEDVQNEVLAAIELAFFSIAEEPKGQTRNEPGRSETDYVPCLDELANGMLPKPISDGNDEAIGSDMDLSICKESLRSKVLEKDESDIETQPTKLGHVRTFNGLLTVPKGISVSTCPALQVIAHNVIVGSVGAVSVREVSPYSALQKALQAFKSVWSELPLKGIPTYSGPNEHGKCKIFVYKENLVCKSGLRHIQKLICIPDNGNRANNNINPLAAQNQIFWESLYENLCCDKEGSIVVEIYPDYYKNDQQALGEKIPYYSEENIKGAVTAAIKVREKMRKDGKEPVSIMFAGMDQRTYTRISDELQNAHVERAKAKSEPILYRDRGLLDNLLTPEKFPPAAVNDRALQNVVRMVPGIRKKLNSEGLEKKQQSLVIDSSSDSDASAFPA
jgi:hypothetical protein